MTRECKADFDALLGYITEYEIKKNLSKKSYCDSLKQIHKCYFALVTWRAEILYDEGMAFINSAGCTNEIVYRINESISDLGASLFNWINGSYKASRVMLRVGIENFIRALSAIDDNTQLQENSVRVLFEKARSLGIFNCLAEVRVAFDQIHSDYVFLCADIHTAAEKNMEQLSSLADLPFFKKDRAEQSSTVFIRIARNLNFILSITFNPQYLNMHHRNRENILHCISAKQKPLVLLNNEA